MCLDMNNAKHLEKEHIGNSQVAIQENSGLKMKRKLEKQNPHRKVPIRNEKLVATVSTFGMELTVTIPTLNKDLIVILLGVPTGYNMQIVI